MFNPPESEFSKLDFNKADWANLRADISSLSFVDVYSSMNAIDVNVSKVIETIGHCCMLIVPLKSFKSFKVTHFHRERKILMRKRRKLMKKTIHDSKISETLKIYSSIPLKKTAFCLKTSHFINKYDSPRSQLCQWPRLVHNCNQSFNMSQTSVYFDSHQNIPASHLGIPGGIENLDLQY